MQVTLLLADYAQVADGKLTVVGGGWSITGPGPVPYAIAGYLKVPWDQTNVPHTLRLELVDADGNTIEVETPEGVQPVFLENTFTVGRPADLKPGTPIDYVFAVNFAPGPPVPPDGRYEWRATVDGQANEDWNLAFTTRPEEGDAEAG